MAASAFPTSVCTRRRSFVLLPCAPLSVRVVLCRLPESGMPGRQTTCFPFRVNVTERSSAVTRPSLGVFNVPLRSNLDDLAWLDAVGTELFSSAISANCHFAREQIQKRSLIAGTSAERHRILTFQNRARQRGNRSSPAILKPGPHPYPFCAADIFFDSNDAVYRRQRVRCANVWSERTQQELQ